MSAAVGRREAEAGGVRGPYRRARAEERGALVRAGGGAVGQRRLAASLSRRRTRSGAGRAGRRRRRARGRPGGAAAGGFDSYKQGASALLHDREAALRAALRRYGTRRAAAGRRGVPQAAAGSGAGDDQGQVPAQRRAAVHVLRPQREEAHRNRCVADSGLHRCGEGGGRGGRATPAGRADGCPACDPPSPIGARAEAGRGRRRPPLKERERERKRERERERREKDVQKMRRGRRPDARPLPHVPSPFPSLLLPLHVALVTPSDPRAPPASNGRPETWWKRG